MEVLLVCHKNQHGHSIHEYFPAGKTRQRVSPIRLIHSVTETGTTICLNSIAISHALLKSYLCDVRSILIYSREPLIFGIWGCDFSNACDIQQFLRERKISPTGIPLIMCGGGEELAWRLVLPEMFLRKDFLLINPL